MAIVTVPDKNLTLTDAEEIKNYLSTIEIDYERWDADGARVSPDAEADEILQAYAPEIEILKKQGGYVVADVIDIKPTIENLETMLDRFRPEHWHDEDEVRFIVKGHGRFHIAPSNGDVTAVTMEAGDLIRVPRGTKHWFDLCEDRTVRAIRLFQDTAGWTPHYTESETEQKYK